MSDQVSDGEGGLIVKTAAWWIQRTQDLISVLDTRRSLQAAGPVLPKHNGSPSKRVKNGLNNVSL